MKMRTLIGGIMLLIGFIMYQTGLSTALEQNQIILIFVTYTASALKLSLETDIVILILEYVGGIIAILGLLVCISSLTTKEERAKPLSKDTKKEIRKSKQLDPELQSAIEKTLKSS